MASQESQNIRAGFTNDREALNVPLAVQREEWIAGAAKVTLPPSIVVAPAHLGELSGEWISSRESDPRRVILFLHGGGYTSGSAVTHRELAARISLASGIQVLLPNYRLAPEHPFPAAVEDAAASYRWLLDNGYAPNQIAIGGDSAGAGLALASLLMVRDQGVALPAAGVLLSPWTDLSQSGPTLESNAARDPLTSREGLQQAADLYLAGADPMNPLASPLFGELSGLPSTLIQVGEDEVLLSDSTRLAEKANAAGSQATLEVEPGMWHVWQSWAGEVPEGQVAIDRIGAFVRGALMRRRG